MKLGFPLFHSHINLSLKDIDLQFYFILFESDKLAYHCCMDAGRDKRFCF